jgi:outer membrane receptor for ferrienterochelin and colicin
MKSLRNLFFVVALIAIPAFSQELTSDITGVVTNSAGAPVSGANVSVTYTPTNTTITRTTSANGRFNAGGLKPGGPYDVSVQSGAYNSETASGITLVVGDTRRLNFALESIDEVVVVATRSVSLDTGYGFGTALTAQDIAQNASVNRDLKDFVRLNPLVSLDDAEDNYEAISIAGAHPRTNDLRVDGVSFNDDFGLNANGYPAQRSPISLNAIEQLSVKVAPASVEYSGFRGGVIEVITKSGTNEFSGEFFTYDRGDSLMGDESNGDEYSFDLEDTSEGFTFGGPIIKDKAYFFVTYEEATINKPITHGPIGSGLPNEQGITIAEVDQIRNIAKNKYGFDPLSYTSSNSSAQEFITARFDINITDNHRLTLNHKEVESSKLNGANSSFGIFNFSSAEYQKGENTTTDGLLLVSNWSDDLITEISYSTKEQNTSQMSPVGQNLPSFTIENCGAREINCNLGPDIFRSANALQTENTFFKAKLTYYDDNHKWTAGYETKEWDIYNVFIVAQNGQYDFDGISGFESQQATGFFHNNSRDLTEQGGAAVFTYDLTSLYIQDEIEISDKLNVLLGLRYDEFDSDDAPSLNQGFKDTYGFANGGIAGTDLLNYRFSFEYEIDDVSSLKGLYGTFSSKLPTVWISNAYTNDGVRIAAYNGSNAPGCDPTSGVTSTLPACVNTAIQNAPLTDAVINFIAPSFTWPETKTLNLTYDRQMGDWLMTATYLHSDQEEALYKIIDGSPLNGDQPLTPTLKAPDGRPIYNQTGRGTYKGGLYTESGGERDVFSVAFSRYFNDGDGSFSMGYTHQDIQELSGMASTTANSSYGKYAASDYNNRTAQRSIYETEHRFFATASSTHYFLGADKPTTFNLYFERKSGLPGTYSWDTYTSSNYGGTAYQQEAFGYEKNLNDDSSHLLYVPSGVSDPNVCWGSCAAPDLAIAAQVLDTLYNKLGLQGYAGQIVPNGVYEYPWRTSLDLKITQILPGFRAEDEFVISLGIMNLLNLLDSDKGEAKYGPYNGKMAVLDMYMNEDFTKYIYPNYRGRGYPDYAYGFNSSNPKGIRKSAVNSIWRAQLGFTYKFSF